MDYLEKHKDLIFFNLEPFYGSSTFSALSYFQDHRHEYDENLKELKLNQNTFLDFEKGRLSKLKIIEQTGLNAISSFTGTKNIKINEVFLMVNASTYPVKFSVDFFYNNKITNGTFFLKDYTPTRILFYDLFKIFCQQSLNYDRKFSNNLGIVETQVKGLHLDEMKNDTFLNSKAYRKSKIEMDAFSFLTGLDDLKKSDNYIISKNGTVTIIDFDVAFNFKMDVESIKEETMEELDITKKSYDFIYNNYIIQFKKKYKRNGEKIENILNMINALDEGGNDYISWFGMQMDNLGK